MNKENLIKILVPIVAVVVIAESVILVSGLNKSETQLVAEVTPFVSVMEEKINPVADFVFSTDTKDMEVGKAYEVSLNLSANEDFAVDAIEAHVKYDPAKLTVSKLVEGDDLPETATLKVDTDSGLVNAIFLVPVEDREGYLITTGDNKNVLSFLVTPKEIGTFSLGLVESVADGDLPTVLPETGTNQSLPFTTNKLEINVTE